ncbi:MAG: RNA methyltransferase [Bacteroidia bacterium]|nr:RNA methyltransferase [Bacteroidia bacterium]NNM23857.1 RNA methyltransferase [Flavobacteriaceae bacterium]
MNSTNTELLEHLLSYLTERRRELFRQVMDERTFHFTLATEDVYQLHNTSAVIRSCDVFGIQDVHIIEEQLGKKLDREIAMGAQKWVSVHRHSNSKDCVSKLRSSGYRIIATIPHGEATPLEEFDVTRKSVFFFGKEKEGLSQDVLDTADEFLQIPMFGFTESLNISVSAAIILHHVVTQLRKSEVDWKLNPQERLELELHWAKRSVKSSEEIIKRFLNDKNS